MEFSVRFAQSLPIKGVSGVQYPIPIKTTGTTELVFERGEMAVKLMAALEGNYALAKSGTSPSSDGATIDKYSISKPTDGGAMKPIGEAECMRDSGGNVLAVLIAVSDFETYAIAKLARSS